MSTATYDNNILTIIGTIVYWIYLMLIRPVPIVARAKRVLVNLKHARHVNWLNIVMLAVRRHIVHNIKKNVGNVQLSYTMKIYLNSHHQMKIVPYVSYGCHLLKRGQDIWFVVERIFAVDVFMLVP